MPDGTECSGVNGDGVECRESSDGGWGIPAAAGREIPGQTGAVPTLEERACCCCCCGAPESCDPSQSALPAKHEKEGGMGLRAKLATGRGVGSERKGAQGGPGPGLAQSQGAAK